jgi:hypothetical protein
LSQELALLIQAATNFAGGTPEGIAIAVRAVNQALVIAPKITTQQDQLNAELQQYVPGNAASQIPHPSSHASGNSPAELGGVGPTGAAGASSTSPVTMYPHAGFVYDQASADKNLPGASDAFKQYVAQEGAARHAQSPKECSEQGGVEVDAYDTRGYATGSVLGCGGVATIWYETSAGWKEIDAQNTWGCGQLQNLGVPSALFTPEQRVCLNVVTNQAVPYEHK